MRDPLSIILLRLLRGLAIAQHLRPVRQSKPWGLSSASPVKALGSVVSLAGVKEQSDKVRLTDLGRGGKGGGEAEKNKNLLDK